jgi:hypothetical protein
LHAIKQLPELKNATGVCGLNRNCPKILWRNWLFRWMTYFSSIDLLQNYAKLLANLAKSVYREIINVQRPILSLKCGLFNPISINLIKENIYWRPVL